MERNLSRNDVYSTVLEASALRLVTLFAKPWNRRFNRDIASKMVAEGGYFRRQTEHRVRILHSQDRAWVLRETGEVIKALETKPSLDVSSGLAHYHSLWGECSQLCEHLCFLKAGGNPELDICNSLVSVLHLIARQFLVHVLVEIQMHGEIRAFTRAIENPDLEKNRDSKGDADRSAERDGLIWDVLKGLGEEKKRAYEFPAGNFMKALGLDQYDYGSFVSEAYRFKAADFAIYLSLVADAYERALAHRVTGE